MTAFSLYVFIFAMWILIIVGGGIAILILAPISITGYGDFDQIISSGLKALVAIALVIAWIFILTKVKNWIFSSHLRL